MGLMKSKASTQTTVEPITVSPEDLLHTDPEIRRRAAQTVCSEDAVSTLIDALQSENNPGVRAAMFNALRDISGPSVAVALTPLLGSEDTDIRNGAVAVMKTLGTGVGDIMPELLSRSDSDIRIMAIDILQDLGHPSAPEWLENVLKQDPHANVVGAAIDRMVEIGTIDHCDALRDAARRFADDPFIAFAAAEAIKAIEAGSAT